MKRFLTVIACVCFISVFASADITATGDVSPYDPDTWTTETTAYIGNTAIGTFIVNDGDSIDNEAGYVGYYKGSEGTATITGADSNWTLTKELVVGNEGYGKLRIVDAATVNSETGLIGGYLEMNLRGITFPINPNPDPEPDGTGLVIIDGENSRWTVSDSLKVGDLGRGVLNITNGGGLLGNTIFIGGGYRKLGDAHFAKGTGNATVDGEGSYLTATGALAVGALRDGEGTLDIINGGDAVSDMVIVGGHIDYGIYGSGKIAVDGAGSSLTVNGKMDLAGLSSIDNNFAHHDSLVVSRGGSVTSNNAKIYSSKVTVNGIDSLWKINGILDICDGDLEIKNSGVVESDRITLSGINPMFGDGVLVYLDGGTIKSNTISSDCEIDAFRFTSGYLHVDNYSGKLQVNGGTVCPGNSSNLMSVSGNFKLFSGSIQTDIGGLTRGIDYDAIDVGGNFRLEGGSLDVELLEDFQLDYNQIFTIVNVSGSLVGRGYFDGLVQDSLVGTYNGIELFISYTAGDGNDVALYTAIPEPCTMAMFAIGGMILRKSKIKNKNSR